jgi:acetyltransferase-like isoleucine patch superfamily enzyme
MNSFYSKAELYELGFKSIGDEVYISKKASFYAINKISIGNNVRIDDFCIISGNVTLGNHIHIAAYCGIYGSYGVELEDFTGLSPRCTIFSSMDDFSGDFLISPTTKKEHNNLINGKVIIKKYSQLGIETVIFPNITFEEGCATGAKTLVTKSTLPWGIYIGQPAKRLKERNKGLLKFINEY